MVEKPEYIKYKYKADDMASNLPLTLCLIEEITE